MGKHISPEEQKRAWEAARKANNARILRQMGKDQPLLLKVKTRPRYDEPAEVISLNDRRSKE